MPEGFQNLNQGVYPPVWVVKCRSDQDQIHGSRAFQPQIQRAGFNRRARMPGSTRVSGGNSPGPKQKPANTGQIPVKLVFAGRFPQRRWITGSTFFFCF